MLHLKVRGPLVFHFKPTIDPSCLVTAGGSGDQDNDEVVPVGMVPGSTLARIIEYCDFLDQNFEKQDFETIVESYNDEFIKALSVEQTTQIVVVLVDSGLSNIELLLQILFNNAFMYFFRMSFQAANFLNVQRLMDAGCRALADIIKDKTVEEMRAIFGIEGDFTPEEEEKIKKQNAWCQGAFK